MKEKLINLSRNNTLLSILMIILGVVLVIWPAEVARLATQITGIALVVVGVLLGVNWYNSRHLASSNDAELMLAVVALVSGAFMLFLPGTMLALAPMVVGLVVLVSGIHNLAQAFDLKKATYVNWNYTLVLAIITILCGLLILAHPIGMLKLPIRIFGVVLIYNGVSNLWLDNRCKKFL